MVDHVRLFIHSKACVTAAPFAPVISAMIEALQAENADLKKNLGLAGSRQNELKVRDGGEGWGGVGRGRGREGEGWRLREWSP